MSCKSEINDKNLEFRIKILYILRERRETEGLLLLSCQFFFSHSMHIVILRFHVAALIPGCQARALIGDLLSRTFINLRNSKREREKQKEKENILQHEEVVNYNQYGVVYAMCSCLEGQNFADVTGFGQKSIPSRVGSSCLCFVVPLIQPPLVITHLFNSVFILNHFPVYAGFTFYVLSVFIFMPM